VPDDRDRDQRAELGEAARVGEEESEKSYRSGERAEENGAAELGDRFCNRRGVFNPFVPRLLIPAEDQDGKIHAEPNEDGAHSDRYHVELVEDEEPGGERDEAAKEERESHTHERQPATKAGVENSTDKEDRAEEGDDNVVPHAERDLGDVCGAPGHQDLERCFALPALARPRAKRVHFHHQCLAVERADRWLIGDREKNSSRSIGRSQRLTPLVERSVAGERLERRRDDA